MAGQVVLWNPFQAAEEFTLQETINQRVKIFASNVDRHGRVVAVVKLPDGRELNRELLRLGLAWWYEKYAPDERLYRLLEKQARREVLAL